MKIAIYDTQHYEMVNVLFNIFNIKDCQILFLIDSKIFKKLNNSPFTNNKLSNHIFLLENKGDSNEFYKDCSVKLKEFNPDLIIFNTIDKDYSKIWDIIKNLNCKVAVTIHNINTWLNPPFTLNRIALSNYWFRKKIVKKTSFLIVQEELFINYIRGNNLYKKPITAVPHTIPESDTPSPNNQKLRVAIPGGIDGVRRDYNFAIDVIESVCEKTDRIQFVFLGEVIGHLGEKVWQRVKQLQEKGLDILHFFDPNSNLLFDSEFQKSDLVFLPLNVDTKYEGIPEVYGTTKVTGVIYDMMRFAKPGFVPHKMVIPLAMKDSLFDYTSKNELVNYLLDWANDPTKVVKGNQMAEQNSKYYSADKVRDRFWTFYKTNFDKK